MSSQHTCPTCAQTVDVERLVAEECNRISTLKGGGVIVLSHLIAGVKNMIDPELFGREMGKVIKEIIDPLKKQIEELQQRVTELENLTEGLK